MALKIKEIRAMGAQELKSKQAELKKEMMKVQAQVASGTTPKSPGQPRQIRRTIAQIMTVLRDKGAEDKKDQVKNKKH